MVHLRRCTGQVVAGQVLVLVVHTVVHNRHVDAVARVSGPYLLDAYVLFCAVAKLVVVVEVPLAAVERVVDARAPGDVGAAVYKIGVAPLRNSPDGVTSRV